MKKTVCLLFCMTLLFLMSSPVTAALLKPKLSDMSELECFEFIKNQGVDIPDDYEDETVWAPFVKQTIELVEEDPDYPFAYSYTVTHDFAEAIRDVVNRYYSSNSVSTVMSDASTFSRPIYTLQDSTPIGSWNASYKNYNCYAYSIGITNAKYNPGMPSGDNSFSLSMSLDDQVDLILSDLSFLGYNCISTSYSCPDYSIWYDGFHTICYRIGDDDFHFMRMDSSYWSHKPSIAQPLKYNYTPTMSRIWSNEAIVQGVTFSPSIYYTSELRFITFAENCNLKYTYLGNEIHKAECKNCDYAIPSQPCSIENIYCGSMDIGDYHHPKCIDCSHVFNTDADACTLRWVFYGPLGGNNYHVRQCTVCGNQSGTIQPCQYSTPGLCDYCG